MTDLATPPPTGVTSPWTCAAVGAVRAVTPPEPDDPATDTGSLTLAMERGTLDGRADALALLFQPVDDRVDFVARVTIHPSDGAEARAGLMLRESLAADSVHVTLLARPSRGPQVVTRSTTGTGPSTADLVRGGRGGAHPGWLRLVRTGHSVSAYTSLDGSTWDLVATRHLPVSGTVLAGLVVCSGSAAAATFDETRLVELVGEGPTAVVSGPGTGETGRPLAFSGAASHDPDDSITRHSWHTSDGQSATGPLASFAFARAGTHTVTLTVSDGAGNTSTDSTTVVVTDSLPDGWAAGAVGTTWAGTAGYRNGTFTLSATSGAISASHDGFEFVYREVTGDADIVARLESVTRDDREVDVPPPNRAQPADPDFRDGLTERERVFPLPPGPNPPDPVVGPAAEARTGLMIRESLEADAPHVSLLARRTLPPQVVTRAVGEAATSATELAGTGGFPKWLRLTRTGRVVRAFTSVDGATWVLQGTHVVHPAATLFVGLVTSPQVPWYARGTATATFTHVRLTPPGAAPTAVISGPGGEGGGAPPVPAVFSSAARALELHHGRTGETLTFSAHESTQPTGTIVSHVWRTSDGRRATGPTAPFVFREPGTYTVTLTVSDEEGITDSATATVLVTAALPEPWHADSIGRASSKGTAHRRVGEGAFTVTTAGVPADSPETPPSFPPTADALQLLWQPVRGDVELVTRLVSIGGAGAGDARAGLSIRQSPGAHAAHVSLLVPRDEAPQVVTRATDGGATSVTYLDAPTGLPRWLRLVRSGHTISAYTSSDGIAWVLRASRTVAMTGTVFAGLAVTGDSPAAAEFASTSVSPVEHATSSWTLGIGEHTG